MTGVQTCALPICLNWESVSLDIFCALQEKREEKEQLVQSFEKSCSAGASVYFTARQERVFDRSVLRWKDINGYALAYELVRELGLKSNAFGLAKGIESASRCRWEGLNHFSWLDGNEGIVVIHESLIKEGLWESLEQAAERVLELQQPTQRTDLK